MLLRFLAAQHTEYPRAIFFQSCNKDLCRTVGDHVLRFHTVLHGGCMADDPSVGKVSRPSASRPELAIGLSRTSKRNASYRARSAHWRSERRLHAHTSTWRLSRGRELALLSHVSGNARLQLRTTRLHRSRMHPPQLSCAYLKRLNITKSTKRPLVSDS